MFRTVITLTDAAPMPVISDITGINHVPLTALDLAIRGNKSAIFCIPLRVAGYSDLLLGLYTPTAYNQVFTVTLSGSFDEAASITAGLASFTIPAESLRFTVGARAVGQGGTAGGAAAAAIAHYAVPALLDPWPYILLTLTTGTAPTQGKLQLSVARA